MQADSQVAAIVDDATPPDVKTAAGLFRLQEWLIALYRQQLAYQDENGVICVVPRVAARFALGIKPAGAFVVMPDFEVEWASCLRWSHAAMRAGKPQLFLVTEPAELGGAPTPAFGMSFVVSEARRAMALQEHATIELRQYVVKGDERWGVSETPFAQMPLIIVGEDENVFDARAKRTLKASNGSGGRL